MNNTRSIGLEVVNGEEIGRDPRRMTAGELAALGHVPAPVLSLIAAKCTDCCGGSRAEARKCVLVSCSLWPLRTGANPLRAKRSLSDTDKAALRDRLARKAA